MWCNHHLGTGLSAFRRIATRVARADRPKAAGEPCASGRGSLGGWTWPLNRTRRSRHPLLHPRFALRQVARPAGTTGFLPSSSQRRSIIGARRGGRASRHPSKQMSRSTGAHPSHIRGTGVLDIGRAAAWISDLRLETRSNPSERATKGAPESGPGVAQTQLPDRGTRCSQAVGAVGQRHCGPGTRCQ